MSIKKEDAAIERWAVGKCGRTGGNEREREGTRGKERQCGADQGTDISGGTYIDCNEIHVRTGPSEADACSSFRVAHTTELRKNWVFVLESPVVFLFLSREMSRRADAKTDVGDARIVKFLPAKAIAEQTT